MKELSPGDLFIVDNSNEEWSARAYLEEWSEYAHALDIATGYFEIGSLLALDGKWQRLDKIRILMGDEVTPRTRAALLASLKAKVTTAMDSSLENAKDGNDFLRGVAPIVEAMRDGRIERRVYARRKFHAKAYITHMKGRVFPPIALVGSSNFTLPGLTQNIELNIQVRQEVHRLQEWFENYWQEADTVNDEVLKQIEHHAREASPFEVWARALHELFHDAEPAGGVWEPKALWDKLASYQQSGCGQMWSIAQKWGGAFLCDGVGLGKTYVGLMIIGRLLSERKKVVLLAPKSVVPMWEDALRREMPGALSVWSNIKIYAHTDLGVDAREGEWQDVKREADAFVVDEAHHFRNPGPIITKSGRVPRYRRLQEIAEGKQLFLLTATPINNSLRGLQHMIELFSGRRDDFFKTLGVANLPLHFKAMEIKLSQTVASQTPLNGAAPTIETNEVETNEVEARQVLTHDKLCEELLVQRSRSFVRDLESAPTSENGNGNGSAPIFPIRRAPQVADYSIKQNYGRLLERLERAFDKEKPLFSLSIYYPLAYVRAPIQGIDAREENRQHQVVGLIRTNFLKRFESSSLAFEMSCRRLMAKLLAFVEENVAGDAEQKTLAGFKARHADVIGDVSGAPEPADLPDANPESAEEDSADETAGDIPVFGRKDYKVDEIVAECFNDLEELAGFLGELARFQPEHDDKLRALIKLLNSPQCKGRKVLIFTQFTETARYLKTQLETQFPRVEQLDGSRHVRDRSDVIRRFSPFYNGSSHTQLAQDKQQEIEILISTDVLSEGLNLQDATRLINYDLHWNPVRLMQRIGRIDRRLNPIHEALLRDLDAQRVNADGEVEVCYWNFLPPAELDTILKLYTLLTRKTLLISRTLGIEGRQLLTDKDDYAALRDFNRALDGEDARTAREILEVEYRKLLEANPDLAVKLAQQPRRIHSGRATPEGGQARGLFFCYALPSMELRDGKPVRDENDKPVWNEQSGSRRWVFWDLETSRLLEQEGEIARLIRSTPETPRRVTVTQEIINAARKSVEAHFDKSYFRAAQAPLGVKAALKCWMEIG